MKTSNFNHSAKSKSYFPEIRPQRLAEALIIKSVRSNSNNILPSLSSPVLKKSSHKHIKKAKKRLKHLPHEIITISSGHSDAPEPSAFKEINLKALTSSPNLNTLAITDTKQTESLNSSRIIETNEEDFSDSIDEDKLISLKSISSVDMNFQTKRSDTNKKFSIESNISELTTRISGINKTFKRGTTIRSLLEEMNSTENIFLFNELKIKVVKVDHLSEGENGNQYKWRLIEVLGNGTFGQVLKAIAIQSGKLFAVKRLYYNTSNPQQLAFLNTLQQEINILQRLCHPHIVKYLGSERINDNFCIYLEYLSGGSMSSLLNKLGPLPEITVKVYMQQVLKGLLYLHSNNVIHRDLKCDNILLDSSGRLKICDFGCAKVFTNANDSGLNQSVKGSLQWMAPEVMKQSGYGRKADIWSLGCVAIEMLTGKPPWSGVENQVNLMMKVLIYYESPKIPESASSICKDFLTKCLIWDSNNRPSARELLSHPFCKK